MDEELAGWQAELGALLRFGMWGGEAPVVTDWQRVIGEGRCQAVIGMVADAVSRLPQDRMPEPDVQRALRAEAMRLVGMNTRLNAALASVVKVYADRGIEGVLLKGQGVAQYYPQPLVRECGDIDFYVGEGRFADAIALARERWPEGDCDPAQSTYKHYHFKTGEAEVELHRKAAICARPWMARRFDRWMTRQLQLHEPLMVSGVEVRRPVVELDAVYIFYHAFSHFVHAEGVGLRQFCDWAMVLNRHYEVGDRAELERVIRDFGLERPWQILGGVVVDFLGLPPERMPLYSTRYARLSARVLEHVMRGGNFGHHKAGRKRRPEGYWTGKLHTLRTMSRNVRDMAYLSPADVLGSFAWFCTTGAKRCTLRLCDGLRP